MSFEKFQRPVYASAMILGIAFQAGKLPFSILDIQSAFSNAVPRAEISFNWEAFQMGRDWYLNQTKYQVVPALDDKEIWEDSIRLAAYPWQSGKRLVNLWTTYTKMLCERFAEIPVGHIRQYVHDLIVFDQGKHLGTFYEFSLQLKTLYKGEALPIALRVMAKTFWIKDEVFVSHLMLSPLKRSLDKERYKNIGTRFEVVHINRPAFVILGKKIEFDFSPKLWMLRLMKNFRFLRLILPDWHKSEREIAQAIRDEVLSKSLEKKRLLELDNVKGYRDIRYKFATKYVGKKYV